MRLPIGIVYRKIRQLDSGNSIKLRVFIVLPLIKRHQARLKRKVAHQLIGYVISHEISTHGTCIFFSKSHGLQIQGQPCTTGINWLKQHNIALVSFIGI